MWYRISAYNEAVLYGWTTDHEVVETALNSLNKNREINVYSTECLGNDENENGDGDAHPEAIPLRDRSDLLFNDDTRPDDFQDNA